LQQLLNLRMSALLKYIVIALSTINFGYMVIDGLRALVKGDYFRPRSGPYAGQLGPWTKVVVRIGVEPESTLMKLLFVAIGLLGLIITGLYATGKIDELPMMIVVVLSIWNLYLGTMISLLMLVLLIVITMLN
jgi:hypothetical protein